MSPLRRRKGGHIENPECMYVVLDRTKSVGWLDRYKLPLHAAHIRVRLHTYMLILTSTSLTLLLYFQATDGEIGKVFGQTRLRKKILGWVSRIQVVNNILKET